MNRASDRRCVFLGRPADHLHHVTGRDAAGSYLDPALVLPLTRRQHVVEHVGWNVAAIGDGISSDLSVLRLRRTAHLWVRLGEHHAPGLVGLPAPYLIESGYLFQRIAAHLELVL